jgi:hypothetical protein
MSAEILTFPPFGEALYQRLKTGYLPKNDIFLFLGFNAVQAAKKLRHQQRVLALPWRHTPYRYIWPVDRCSILGIDKGGLLLWQIEEIAYVLLLSGAIAVRVILSNHDFVVYSRD